MKKLWQFVLAGIIVLKLDENSDSHESHDE